MATAAQKKEYVKIMNALMAQFMDIQDDVILQSILTMETLEAGIAYELSLAKDYSAYHIQQIIDNLQDDVAQYNASLTRVTTSAGQQAATMGALYVVEPINALGLEQVFVSANPVINVLTGFSADLITSISNEILKAINTELKLTALGGLSPYEAMKRITDILGVQADKLTGIAYRAERILRTELMRIFNMSTFSQQMATAQMIPGVTKNWMATGDWRTRETHLMAHSTYAANPIPIDRPFWVGGFPLMHPGDPAAPPQESINCRCSSATIHPEIGYISTPLDDRIAAEIDRRSR